MVISNGLINHRYRVRIPNAVPYFMFELIFAVFDYAPIACEGDDVNANTISKFVDKSQVNTVIDNTITDCIIFWDKKEL